MLVEKLVPLGVDILKQCGESPEVVTPTHLDVLALILARMETGVSETCLDFMIQTLQTVEPCLHGQRTPQTIALGQVRYVLMSDKAYFDWVL